MELYIADAFTDERFQGNQAGVALLEQDEDFPEEGFMMAVAGELKHSETVFVKQAGDGVYEMRFFTPAAEVDLCGHATIAAFAVLRDMKCVSCRDYMAKTKAGGISVSVGKDCIWMDMAPARIIKDFDAEGAECRDVCGEDCRDAMIAELYGAYGLDSRCDRAAGFSPAVAATGLADILLPVTEDALGAAVQNREEVIRLSRKYEAGGFHLYAPGCGGYAAKCRNFAPLYGIEEEAATGTSNGALTWYLYSKGRIEEERENVFLQGVSMGKPSEIRSRLIKENGILKIRIGGNAAVSLKINIL